MLMWVILLLRPTTARALKLQLLLLSFYLLLLLLIIMKMLFSIINRRFRKKHKLSHMHTPLRKHTRTHSHTHVQSCRHKHIHTNTIKYYVPTNIQKIMKINLLYDFFALFVLFVCIRVDRKQWRYYTNKKDCLKINYTLIFKLRM